MNLEQFGILVRTIREKLNINQKELAKELDVKQTIISRLELGKGGTIEIAFKVIAYFQKKGIRSHMIFFEPFDEELLFKDPNQELVSQLKAISTLVQKL